MLESKHRRNGPTSSTIALRSSPRIFSDLAHLSDTRKAHQWLHWAPSLRRKRLGGKGGVKDVPALAEEPREHLVRDHPSLRPADDQVWEIVQTSAYDSLRSSTNARPR